MITINISENSDISSAAPEAVPSMRECRHRPRTADIPAVQDFAGRTTRGRSSASDSLSESESSSITWDSWDSWPWPCPLPGKKTSTERMVRKPIPSRAYPNGNASADLSSTQEDCYGNSRFLHLVTGISEHMNQGNSQEDSTSQGIGNSNDLRRETRRKLWQSSAT